VNLETGEKARTAGQILTMAITFTDLIDELQTMSGVKFIMYRALCQNHPELQEDDMGQLIGLDNFDEALAILPKIGAGINPPPAGEVESPSDGSPASPS